MDTTLQNILDFFQPMRDFVSRQPDWVVQFVLAVVALVLLLLMRRLLVRLVETPIRNTLQKMELPQVENIMDALMLPLNLLVLALALAVSIQIFTPDSSTGDTLDIIIRSIIYIAAFIALFRVVDIFALDTSRLSMVTGLNMDERLIPLLRTTLKVLLITLALITIFSEWKVDISGLLASVGIIGLAFSLAAQYTISNLFGFSTIIGDRTFLVGEFIKSGDIEGIVESVGVRSTSIRTSQGGVMIVPNSTLANGNVERFSRRRIAFELGVTYSTTADQMETLLERLREMLRQRDLVINSSIAVHFIAFSDSALSIDVMCDSKARSWRQLRDEREAINLGIMRLIKELDLTIAYPTRSLYIDGLPPEQVRTLAGQPSDTN
jgi:MscS family membrane protein